MDFKVRADIICSLSASFSECGACWCQRWAGPGDQVTHAPPLSLEQTELLGHMGWGGGTL